MPETVPVTVCVVCALRFFKEPRRTPLWCLTTHGPGECCHVGDVMVADDGTHFKPAQHPHCQPMDF